MNHLQQLGQQLRSHRRATMTACGALVLGLSICLSSLGVKPDQHVLAATRDAGSVVMGVNRTGSVPLTADGIGQSFLIPSLSASPSCDNQQYVAITSIALDIQASSESTDCLRRLSDVTVEIRESRHGSPVASARLYLDYPMPMAQSVSAEFSEPVKIRPDTTYYLVAIYRPDNRDAIFLDHWTNHDLAAQGQRMVPIDQFPDSRYTGRKANGEGCTVSPAVPEPTVSVGTDSGNVYTNGDSDTAGTDFVGSIGYSFIIESRVLVLYYDPVIGVVNFSDTLGSVPSHDYGDTRLSDILYELGGARPTDAAHQLAMDIEKSSGGSVDIVLEEYTLDEWPSHASGTASWWDDIGMLGNIQPFTAWTNDTWPCYPHIPESEVIGGQNRFRRSCYASVSSSFDYAALFGRTIRDNQTVLELLNDGEFDDIWVFADPTSRLKSATLAVPLADNGFDIGEPAMVIQGLAKRVPVMGFSYDQDEDTILALYAIRAEQTMAAVLGGNLFPSCLVNALENNTYNRFTRIYGCQVLYAASTAQPGSVGRVLAPPNRSVADASYVLGAMIAAAWDTPVPSDADKWWVYPDLPTPPATTDLSCEQWGCTYRGYLVWWLQHVPANAGMQSGVYNNLWPYVVQPSCFPSVQPARYSATPVTNGP